MVVEFKIKNFRSYREEADFSFEALESDYNPEAVSKVVLRDGKVISLLNSAAIFGANASGKSNVIHALKALSDTVRNSLTYTSQAAPHIYQPYALCEVDRNIPSDFQLDFVVDRQRFSYRVSATSGAITSEALSVYKYENIINVFTRSNREGKVEIRLGRAWPAEKSLKDAPSLLPNQLFLSWLATKDAAGLQNVADYIAHLPVAIDDDRSDYRFDRQKVMENVIRDKSSRIFRQLRNLMRIADIGVDEIHAIRHDDSEFKIPGASDELREKLIERNRWEIRLLHDTDRDDMKCGLPFDLESLGTKTLFCIGARILKTLDEGGFIAFDELNAAIHPALMRLLVNLFHSPKSNPKGAQLLFSTNDPSVADNDTFRADQVWFAEKRNGASELFSAQDFEEVGVRVPFEMWYRGGRFGALPKFGNVDSIFDL